MKLIGLAGILALSSLACQRKEETLASKSAAPAPAEAAASDTPTVGGEKNEAPLGKLTKASERPAVTEKKPPVAEPLPDRPGFVKSPFSGEIIDVKGIPAGTLVADPMYPRDQKKHFRVPEMPAGEEPATEEPAPEEPPAEE